jgi:DnaJ-class molecular chaperone
MAFVQSNMGLDMSQALGGIKQQPGYAAYKILGLERSATEQEVKHRYNELIRILHPDKSGTPGTNYLFQWVLAAYEEIKQERGWK